MELAEERIVENLAGFPAFLVRVGVPEEAWEQRDGRPGFVRFVVIEVDGWDSKLGDGTLDGYGPRSLVFTSDEPPYISGSSSDPEEAIVFASGTVKWDGCVDWHTEDWFAAHGCDAPSLRAGLQAISLGYALAARRTIPPADFENYSEIPA